MSEIYNQFSNEYNQLFAQNILEFFNKCKNENLIDDEFVTFYPSFGVKRHESCDFLIIGQAVNGWNSGFYTGNEIMIESIIKHSIEISNRFCKEYNHTPIDWVNVNWSNSLYEEHMTDKTKREFYEKGDSKYQLYKSFFWNVAFKIVSDYYGMDRNEGWEWSKKIVWSNLYKIAPPNGNPDENQINKQMAFSIKLIKKEIEELKPKFCIVLTNGSWWIPFQKDFVTERMKIDSNLSEILFHEKYLGTQIIVTTRPPVGYGDKHVQQILELIKP